MQDILLSKKQYLALITRLDEIKGDVTSIRLRTESDGNLLDDYDLIKLFHISKRTIQRLRKLGRLPYNKIGSKFYYKADAILECFKLHPDSELENKHPQIGDNNQTTDIVNINDDIQEITCVRCPLFVIFNL